MISNKSKILFGAGGLVILLIVIVLILVMTKSSNTSTDSGLCPNGKSKITCNDNVSRCSDDCPAPVTCPKDQTLITCINGTTQCAPSCLDTSLSWFCQDKDIVGSCQPITGGTGGPVLPDGKCQDGQIKVDCGDGTSQCANCAPNRSWNCKLKECQDHNCCGTSVWDSTISACKNIKDPTKYNVKCPPINDGKTLQVPNADKTVCINECRLDGLLAGEQCYDEYEDSSIYFNSIPSTSKNQRTFCYKTVPDPKDSNMLCYHQSFANKTCDSTSNDDIPTQLNNMKAKGYIQAGQCGGLNSDPGDDCYMPMANNKVAGGNFLSNPEYPVYLYLKNNYGENGFWKESDDTYRKTFDKKPIQCWDTNNPPYISLSACSNNDTNNMSHPLPDNNENFFCDNVLNTIIPKN